MTRKIIVIGFTLLFVLTFLTPVYCDDALKKLGRGAANCLTCPIEITEQISRSNEADGVFAAATVGLLKGVFMTCVRAVVGVYEVATFPIPLPAHYGPILTDPEFFCEEYSW